MTELVGDSKRVDRAPSTARAEAAPIMRRCHVLAVGAAIIAIWLIAASRWILTDTVVPWDSKNQFYAFFRFLALALFMFGGVAAGRLQHTGAILSYSFFPPALLLLQVALDRRSLLAAAGFAVAASALALGRNQVALLLCFVLLAIAVGQVVTAE